MIVCLALTVFGSSAFLSWCSTLVTSSTAQLDVSQLLVKFPTTSACLHQELSSCSPTIPIPALQKELAKHMGSRAFAEPHPVFWIIMTVMMTLSLNFVLCTICNKICPPRRRSNTWCSTCSNEISTAEICSFLMVLAMLTIIIVGSFFGYIVAYYFLCKFVLLVSLVVAVFVCMCYTAHWTHRICQPQVQDTPK